MMKTEANIDSATALRRLETLKGHYVWLSRIEDDRVLRVEFGQPSLLVRDGLSQNTIAALPISKRRLVRPVGEWRLFVGTGQWQLLQDGVSLERRQPAAKQNSAIEQKWLLNFDGQRLSDIAWDKKVCEWQFSFDLGGRLSIKADPMEQAGILSEQWTFFSIRGGRISCQRDDRLVLKEIF